MVAMHPDLRIVTRNDANWFGYEYLAGGRFFLLDFNRKSGALYISSSVHALDDLAHLRDDVKKCGVARLLLPPEDKFIQLENVKSFAYAALAKRSDTPPLDV
jgi:hypothetical protein